jgi:hypothetical protein
MSRTCYKVNIYYIVVVVVVAVCYATTNFDRFFVSYLYDVVRELKSRALERFKKDMAAAEAAKRNVF